MFEATAPTLNVELARVVSDWGNRGHFGRSAPMDGPDPKTLFVASPIAQRCWPSRRQQAGKAEPSLVTSNGAIRGKVIKPSKSDAKVLRIDSRPGVTRSIYIARDLDACFCHLTPTPASCRNDIVAGSRAASLIVVLVRRSLSRGRSSCPAGDRMSRLQTGTRRMRDLWSRREAD